MGNSAFDWENYWSTTDEPEGATKFALDMAKRFEPLIREENVGTFADVGCGPATMLFVLAKMFPDIEFTGYDIAPSLVANNNNTAREKGISNIKFETAILPDVQLGMKYDLVSCVSVLHYILDIETAIQKLYEHVKPGGYLIFNYPNRYTMWAQRKYIEPSDAEMQERFKIILAGQNLITQRDIKKITKTTPKKFYASKRHNIYIKLKKPHS